MRHTLTGELVSIRCARSHISWCAEGAETIHSIHQLTKFRGYAIEQLSAIGMAKPVGPLMKLHNLQDIAVSTKLLT